MLGRLYAVVGWLIVGIGLLHMAATFRLPAIGNAVGKIWFFGSGLAIALVGALNLLHRAYGKSGFGVRIVCRAANVFLTLLAIVAGIVMRASLAERLFIWLLLVAALVLSCSPVQRGSKTA
jgi:hypothetical protein